MIPSLHHIRAVWLELERALKIFILDSHRVRSLPNVARANEFGARSWE